MPDHNAQEILENLMEAQAFLIKKTGLTLDQLVDLLTKAWERAPDPEEDEAEAQSISLAQRNLFGRLLSLWHNDASYLDDQGEPLPLPFESEDGPSFTTLFDRAVGSTAADIDVITTFDLFVDGGTVKPLDDGTYMPTTVAFYVNRSGSSGALANLAYLLEYALVVGANVDGEDKPRFQRVARASEFPTHKLPLLVSMLEDDGFGFLKQVDEFIEKESAKSPPDVAREHVGVGMFMLNKPVFWSR